MLFQVKVKFKDITSVQYTYTLKKAISIKYYNLKLSKAEKVIIVPTCILKKDNDGDFEIFNS